MLIVKEGCLNIHDLKRLIVLQVPFLEHIHEQILYGLVCLVKFIELDHLVWIGVKDVKWHFCRFSLEKAQL